MGLDMYLEKRNYVQKWEHQKPEEQHEVIVKKGGKIVKDIKPERITYVIEQVGYWRKANMIHEWFVQNVQEGEDNCKPYYVEYSQLVELRDLCQSILDNMQIVVEKKEIDYIDVGRKTVDFRTIMNVEEIEEKLPTASGFFFGSTDYDEWYIRDIEGTVEMLNGILEEKNAKISDYYYQSSW